jgi:hypothetical protein
MTEQQQAWEPLPGWYLDPADGRQLRFWDGSQWTQQVKPARTDRRRALLVLGGLVAFWVVVFAFLALWFTLEEHRLRPGLAKTLDEVRFPGGLRLVSEGYEGNSWCIDVCPTLTRRYSSPFSQEETYRVFAAELERLGYQCIRHCGEVDDGETWVQPGKGERAPELYLAVRLTTDLDRYDPDSPRDASRPVHAVLSAR